MGITTRSRKKKSTATGNAPRRVSGTRRVLAALTARPVLLLTVLSFVLSTLWTLHTHPIPFSDYLDYYEIGRDLHDEGQFGYPIPTARRLPGYPALLALAMVVGRGVEWLAFFNIFLAVALIPIVHRLTMALSGSRPAALTAAAICAFNPVFVFFAPIVASEHLFVVLLFASFLALFSGRPSGWQRSLLAGVLAGLAVLTRGEALFYLPVMLYLVWAKTPGNVRRRLLAPAILLAACVVVVTPWLVRNRMVMGPGVGLSTAGGVNFYFGHNSTSYGYHDLTDTPIATDDEAEMQRRAFRRGMATLSYRPSQLLADIGTGTPKLLWDGDTYAVRAALMKYHITAERTIVIRKAFPPGSVPLATWFYRALLPFALAGLCFFRRIGRDRLVLLYGVIFMNWVCYSVVFWSKPRFRFTAEVAVCVLAALTAVALWEKLAGQMKLRRGRHQPGP